MTERPLLFECAGERLVGIVAEPARPSSRGVVVVVGGPQYRVGSHRQFVLLARRLAEEGFATLRFDHRGMGDSGGEPRSFESIDDDIDAAIGALMRAVPAVREVALWGLCDAASALAMYAQRGDRRVAGLALLNPWVRTDASYAAVQVRHYYAARLRNPATWRRLVSGRLDVAASLRDFGAAVGRMMRARRPEPSERLPFQTRMARGLARAPRPVLLVLSGDDLTAREFVEYSGRDDAWRGVLESPNVRRCELPESDHTFSRDAWRKRVEDWTATWLRSW